MRRLLLITLLVLMGVSSIHARTCYLKIEKQYRISSRQAYKIALPAVRRYLMYVLEYPIPAPKDDICIVRIVYRTYEKHLGMKVVELTYPTKDTHGRRPVPLHGTFGFSTKKGTAAFTEALYISLDRSYFGGVCRDKLRPYIIHNFCIKQRSNIKFTIPGLKKGHSVVHRDQLYKIEVNTKEPMYIKIVHTNSNGFVRELYPDGRERSHVLFPNAAHGEWFRFGRYKYHGSGKIGIERFEVMMSETLPIITNPIIYEFKRW